MITNIYQSHAEDVGQDGQTVTELVPFLKSLNSINGYSFEKLVEKIVSLIKNDDQKTFENNYELVFKLILCITTGENFNLSIELVSRLLKVEIPKFNKNDYFINKIRLEMNLFHSDNFKNSVKYAIQSIENEEELESLVKNLLIIHEWDLNNECNIW